MVQWGLKRKNWEERIDLGVGNFLFTGRMKAAN